MNTLVSYRLARIEDVREIATIHATSWRENDRGSYPDSFLDGPVFEDRMSAWIDRVGFPTVGSATFVAQLGAGTVGFAHVRPGEGSAALVENLHVVGALKGQGIGTGLLATVGRFVLEEFDGGLSIWVPEANRLALRFLVAHGGEQIEERVVTPPGGGEPVRIRRIGWSDPTVLCRG